MFMLGPKRWVWRAQRLSVCTLPPFSFAGYPNNVTGVLKSVLIKADVLCLWLVKWNRPNLIALKVREVKQKEKNLSFFYTLCVIPIAIVQPDTHPSFHQQHQRNACELLCPPSSFLGVTCKCEHSSTPSDIAQPLCSLWPLTSVLFGGTAPVSSLVWVCWYPNPHQSISLSLQRCSAEFFS